MVHVQAVEEVKPLSEISETVLTEYLNQKDREKTDPSSSLEGASVYGRWVQSSQSMSVYGL